MPHTSSEKESSKKALTLTQTEDGSFTLFHPIIGEHYHSTRGALQESKHVFLHAGLEYALTRNPKNTISILEVGFGTGLNYLVSQEYCEQQGIHLHYTGIEPYPLSKTILKSMQYKTYIDGNVVDEFYSIYEKSLEREVKAGPHSFLTLATEEALSFQSPDLFDVLYFDAFATTRQPEMWTLNTLSHCCSFLDVGGVFVTYAITGNLKRILKSLGFRIEKVAGARGKREMLRAIKLSV